ncbi:hypothetical protein LB467_04625 [Salegentibacter sp. JZCK2]|uniref:hypothetical protein n=1 Tax=Salegentibacter tibetensis TaxID=2873600 RepID=UPI001CC9B248|nr:hypothetical protein [Salegentibacter tibetensis]MBZ9728962.1 hypothetical protein [Salegentibacter tibetensis]
MKLLKDRLFIKGLVYDAIGMASMAIPVVGPFLDILWAPYAAKKMTEMYPGKKGKVASVIVFIEEILPGTDIIPTFTLMYFYTFIWSKKKQPKEQVIEVEIIE